MSSVNSSPCKLSDDGAKKYISIKNSQKVKLVELYWELREAILNMNGMSRDDFEFGEMFSKIGTILEEIQAPTMMISDEELSEFLNILTRMRVLIQRWVGFGTVISHIGSISNIVKELLDQNRPVFVVENETKRKLMELYNGMQVEIQKAYAHNLKKVN